MSDTALASKSDPSSDLRREKDEWVTRVLGVTIPRSGTSTPSGSGIDTAMLQKARQAWGTTQRKVQRDIEALQTAVITAYAERGLGPQLTAAYQKNVIAAIGEFDEELTDALDRLVATEPENPRWEARLDTARDAVDELRSFIAGNGVIDGLDKNPFGAPLSVRSTLTSSLRAIAEILG